jgi:hypothetical protein
MPQYPVDPGDRTNANIIGDNLGSLPFPGDGNKPPSLLFLPGYRQAGQPTHLVEAMKQHAAHIGLAIINLLRQNQKLVVDEIEFNQLREAVAVRPQKEHAQYSLICNLCGNPVVRNMQLHTQKPMVNGPHFLNQMQSLSPECPHAVISK